MSINFVQSGKDENSVGIKLTGVDTGGTRLWCDTIGTNFKKINKKNEI
ncbi:hypothetical protein ACM55K_17315 [Flavobacterium sp. LT1R49]